MPKPIGRLSSKLFNVIYSTFSSSRSVLSTDVSSGNPEKSEKSEKSERSEKPEKSDKSEKGKLSSVMTPATSTPPAAAAAETTTTTTVSEFPDEKTAKLLQVVPSQSDLISFDELENPDQDPCLNCLDPCNSHSNYPNYLKKKIDYDSPLYNTVKPYIRHVLISTGKGDWETNIEDESDTLASNLHKVKNSIKKDVQKNNDHENTDHSRVIITNSSRINSDNNPSGSDVLIFPDNILIKNVTTNQVTDFYTRFLLPGEGNVINDDNFIIEKMPYRAIIVICSHKRRDKRCGITGPLLKDEFDKILKEKGLDPETRENDGVGVFLSSHTGGHRFAGNVIVYKEGKGIWYGRVVPCHAKSIIEHTIIEGKVIKDLYRGSMNGSFSADCGGRNFDW